MSAPPSPPHVALVDADGTTEVSSSAVGRASVRTIAIWEAIKGVLVLLAAGIAVKLLSGDAEQAVEHVVSHFHLNPAGHTSRIFLRAAENVTDVRLVLLAVGAAAYALLRFVEAWGLWTAKRWGWVLGIASAGLYLPLEVVEMTRRFSATGVVLFAVNLLVIWLLWRNRTRHVRAS